MERLRRRHGVRPRACPGCGGHWVRLR
ncbi:zf-TFIIB domain-containing protein [Roseibacillus ishigakijimensis]